MNYREIAFQRFKEGEEPYCEECGILESEAEVKYRNGLDVHHLDCLPKTHKDYHMNNEPENLKVLCMSCHRTLHNMTDANPMRGRFGIYHNRFGAKHSTESRELMRQSKLGENHHNYGKKLPETHRQRISESNRGQKRSDSARANMSAAHLGVKLSDSHRESMSEAAKKSEHLQTNYQINVKCSNRDRPEGFNLIRNLRGISQAERERLKNLPTYSLEEYYRLIEQKLIE